MTKYCSHSGYGNEGFTDDLIELEVEDDAAYVNLGPAWRMPSEEQFIELYNRNNTTSEWTTYNGVNGYKFTSNTNGNFIFLPAAGLYTSKLFYAETNGEYWSRTLDTSSPRSARNLYSTSTWFATSNDARCHGLSVRPVRLLE